MHPTLIEVFGVEISTFGLMMAVAFLVAGAMCARSFEQVGFSRDAAWGLVTWAMVGGIIGSKLWFTVEAVARNPGLSFTEPLFSRGGITWYGGLLGGAALVLLSAYRSRLDLVTVMNASAPSLAIGQALGRVGCFLVGDDYGRATDLPWGIAFPDGIEPTTAHVHPTQLYEVAWLGIGGLLLWRRRGRSPFLLGEYLVLQGVGRFWMELLRTNPALVGPFTNAQVAAMICVVLGVALWISAAGKSRRAAP
ncbi:MAG: prolipoprotein diacylglyceryl transferase [Myxococcota bacterium]